MAVFTKIKNFKDQINDDPYKSNSSFRKIINSNQEGIFWINEFFDMVEDLPQPLLSLLWQVRRKILDQPLRRIHRVSGEEIRFFALVNSTENFGSSY